MALLNILHYPDKRLHTIAQPVTHFDSNLQHFIDDMAETMYASRGIGLAATQVDVHQQVIVIDLSEEKNQLQVFINPKITQSSGEVEYEEGCLSVPGIFDKVTRAEMVTVEAQNPQGESFTIQADGLLAICIQHEIDHLRGKVFVEYLSRLKQNRIKSKLKKQEKNS